MDFVDLCKELESMEERIINQRRLIQQVKLDIDKEEEMQQQQRRLQERNQPMDKMDMEIEEIRKLMLRSTKEISEHLPRQKIVG
jgi:GTPase involved in cell partitioning and DNA repair